MTQLVLEALHDDIVVGGEGEVSLAFDDAGGAFESGALADFVEEVGGVFVVASA